MAKHLADDELQMRFEQSVREAAIRAALKWGLVAVVGATLAMRLWGWLA